MPAQAARKALVIGNAVYFTLGADGKPFADPKTALPRSIADAEGVAAALREVGFAPQHITTRTNLNAKAFSTAVEEFSKTLNPEDEVVFYFSGHGISTDTGGNFLVPTDGPALDLDATDQLLYKDFQSLTLTLNAFKERKPRLVVAILDACRSYPSRQLISKAGITRTDGLNTTQSADGQLIMFAASHGRAAWPYINAKTDQSPYSVYTRVLIEEIKNPAEHVVTMAQRVSNRVGALTAAAAAQRIQRPEFQSKINGDFTFMQAASKAAAPVPAPAPTDASKDQEIAQLRAQLAQQKPPPPLQAPVLDGYALLPGGMAQSTSTQLTWMRCSLGQSWDAAANSCKGQAKPYTYDQAQQAAKDLNAQGGFGGRSDWRVPTVRELHSIVVCSSGKTKDSRDLEDGGAAIKHDCDGDFSRPTLNTGVYPQTPESVFWTSSPDVGNSSNAWYVNFLNGVVRDGYRSNSYYVRLVRASQ